ncbi:hypothetical protein ACFQH3_09675 [Haladaptatus sp. GCM10025707]|uniref:hypothetical protein n=1 Tax=unclassified Haladaptatus TaxID=2622732 RepID=UPI0023E860C5|nr:hypothetical protein [Haladaptatus sp. QDMS2]
MELKRVFAGPVVLAVFFFLVVPLALGAWNTEWMTPLALPGYLILTIGSALGKALFPTFEFYVFWAPFVLASYAISVGVGFVYRWALSGLGGG